MQENRSPQLGIQGFLCYRNHWRRWQEGIMGMGSHMGAWRCTLPRAGILELGRACALWCGSGFCTEQNRMVLCYWDGATPGIIPMVMGMQRATKRQNTISTSKFYSWILLGCLSPYLDLKRLVSYLQLWTLIVEESIYFQMLSSQSIKAVCIPPTSSIARVGYHCSSCSLYLVTMSF